MSLINKVNICQSDCDGIEVKAFITIGRISDSNLGEGVEDAMRKRWQTTKLRWN